MQALDQACSDTALISGNHSRAYDGTIGQEIERLAALQPNHAAMVSADCSPLSYQELQRLIRETRAALRLAGFGRSARIAIALSNSKQAALAINAVACSAVSIPLSPKLTYGEIKSSLKTVRPDAVLVVQGSDCNARRVATESNIPIIEAVPPKDGAFSFFIVAPLPGLAAPDEADEPEPDAPAFILQTSGTTGEPKLIPFSHRNMLAVADRCRVWFNLTAEDRCLCVSPVFYAHGLKVAILTPLLTGGAVAFPADISKFDYAAWFGLLKPTWYSAAPAIHRLIFDQTRTMPDAKAGHSLRFILSSSAPLPQLVREGLQETLGVPLLEHYSSSEASFMAANLLPPGKSKPGSLGAPWPDSLVVVGDDGRKLFPGEQGEILVRGPTVISGYLDAPNLNARLFRDGWLKTGDIGSLDAEGFLTFHGRKGDVINRGGEKISPAAIDDALLRHPDVAEAVAFPVPHSRLGEDIVAAVVLKPGSKTSPQDLRHFLQKSIAPFKLPRRIHLVESLPKGHTGKIRRRELSQVIGVRPADQVRVTDWDSPIESKIAAIWQNLLQRKDIGPEDDFFELGGDSLLATQMLLELERCMDRIIPVDVLFDSATIRQLANALSQRPPATTHNLLVRLQPDGTKTPFIFVHGDFSQGGYYVANLASLLGPDRTVYSLQSHAILGNHIPSIRQMAADYKEALDAAGVQGPYCLGGHCNGALIALELATQLEAEGRRVELVTTIDGLSLNARPSMRLAARFLQSALNVVCRDAQDRQRRLEASMSLVWWATRWVVARPYPQRPLLWSLVWRAARKFKAVTSPGPVATKANAVALSASPDDGRANLAEGRDGLFETYHRRMAGHIPMPISAPILSIVSESYSQHLEFSGTPWRNLTTDHAVVIVPGDHLSCVTTYADVLTSQLRARLAAVDRKPAASM